MNAFEKNQVKLIGQRLLAEANDLKRTVPTIERELGLPNGKFDSIKTGETELSETLNIAYCFAQSYPVKIGDILIDSDDTFNSMILMRSKQSHDSSRIYLRKNKDNQRTPYYEYRDTATSKFSPFKPEWIKELRFVNDSDPKNADVAYNNGHFLHQMTAVVGPVNFYWEINGEKYCEEMSTGDSNFISPFWKHSFASRNSSKNAYIIAVTFSGSVGRARSELYALGSDSVSNFAFDSEDKRKAIAQLIRQVLKNNMLNPNFLIKKLEANNVDIDLSALMNEEKPKSTSDLRALSDFLELPEDTFYLPTLHPNKEIVVKRYSETDSYLYDEELIDYKITQLAKSPYMPECNGFNIQILANDQNHASLLESTLHTFIYNYTDNPIHILWKHKQKLMSDIISSEDSVYFPPNIQHKFWSSNSDGAVFLFRAPSLIDLKVQKELSSFANKSRVLENSPWFD
jgi:methylphosphonate synthase